jgi:hydroxymethylglutaryl-CoA lyase
VEVGPRDGLQNEPAYVETAAKIASIDALGHAGLDEIEVSSFVSPKWVGQLADAQAVFAGIKRHPDVTYSALVPNAQGLERAQAAHVDKVCVLTAASDTFNRRNVNTDIDGTFARLVPVVTAAKAAGLQTRGYISMAFWCPYEGQLLPDKVRVVVARLLDAGVDEVCLGDTIGKASADEVEALLEVLLVMIAPQRLALHAHDTYHSATANVLRAYHMGLDAFDGSVGGLGGCPYAPGAPGNVATQSVARVLKQAGAEVCVRQSVLDEALSLIELHLSRRGPGVL